MNQNHFLRVGLTTLLLSLFCHFSIHAKVIKKENITNIYGKWKCVGWDYRGMQKFSINQANMLKKSNFYIGKNKMHHNNITFLDSCTYERLEKKYDLDINEWTGTSLFSRYTKEEIKQLIQYRPVDKTGELSCYNDCSNIFIKQDTLISICGGYTYFYKKMYDDVQMLSGAGMVKRRIEFKDPIGEFRLTCKINNDKGQILITDANGKELYSSMGRAINYFETTIVSNPGSYIDISIDKISSKSNWNVKLEK